MSWIRSNSTGSDGSLGRVHVSILLLCLLLAVPTGTAALADADGSKGSASARLAPNGTETELTVTGGREGGDPGGTVTVVFTVRNEGDNQSIAPVLRVSKLPPGWEVVGQESSGAWRSSSREWMWLTLDSGESRRASLTLAVPPDADGTYRIPVEVVDANGDTATGVATVIVGRGFDLNIGVVASVALLVGFVGWLYRAHRPREELESGSG